MPKPVKKKSTKTRVASKTKNTNNRAVQTYFIFSLLVLVGSVLFWSINGARLQLSNSDSLVDPLLFKNLSTLSGATFPGQHTFLLKWPLFWLISLFNYSSASYVVVTVALVLITVIGLVLLMHRIEHRLIVLGTLCLGLASVLLLIPTQPYSGGILPVNMAMLTTRNIEYMFYIGGIVLLSRSTRFKGWYFWLATACFGLLIASDKLFLTVGIGAALLALVVYALARKWEMVTLAADWFISLVIAAIGAIIVLALISSSGLAHISSQSGIGPYNLTNLHGFLLGSFFAVFGILTNFGANPAFDSTVIRQIPHQTITRLLGVGGLPYIVNIIILLVGILVAVRIIYISVFKPTVVRNKNDNASKLSIMLIWSSVVAILLFISSNHDYAVDARYLTIVLFALFIALATYTRKKKWPEKQFFLCGFVLVIAIVLGFFASGQINKNQQAAYNVINKLDGNVVALTKVHPSSVLVGNYWRVIQIEHQSKNSVNVLPLSDCTNPSVDLSSSVWNPGLGNHSFTYLLSYGNNLTNYPNCNLKQIVSVFGKPNASALVAGTPNKPVEQLLFYDHGIHKGTSKTSDSQSSTVLPISLVDLPHTSCDGPSVLITVAHEDDDLLFMNPDVYHDIKTGYCVRTVYLTTGDAGEGQYYWLSRENGDYAAYSAMIGTKVIWVQRIVQLAKNEYATVANPEGNSKISLIYLHLPDGNLKGQGFSESHFESLAKLYSHQIPVINSQDGESSYTYNQLVSAIGSLMSAYSPTEIYTQSTYPGQQFPDHSDHNTVGKFTDLAYANYEKSQFNDLVTIPIHYYEGYTIRQSPPNISGSELATKTDIFINYAQYDSGVCHTVSDCEQSHTYGNYLNREYQNSY